MYAITVSLGIPILTGFLVSCLLWRPARMTGTLVLARGFLGTGIGLGIASCLYFVMLLVDGPRSGSLFPVELGVLISCGLLLVLVRLALGASQETSPEPERLTRSWTTWLAPAFFLVLAAAAVTGFALVASSKPHGDWDAWANWNLRARFIFRGGAEWRRAFASTIPRSQGGYPPLLSVLVARGWVYAGSDTVTVPILIAAVFTFATAGLVGGGIGVLRGRWQGLLAAAAVLATPFVLTHGTSQYADVPLAFFILATLVLISLYNRQDGRPYGLLALAGLTCGFAVCTKHEGLPLLVWLTLVGVLRLAKRTGRGRRLKEAGAFAAGAALPLMVFLIFSTAVASGRSHVSGLTGAATFERLCDVSRYTRIIRAFVGQLFQGDRWVALPVVLPFYLLVVGVGADPRDRGSARLSLLILALMLLTYGGVYLTTPFDLDWLLKWTPDRLFLHLWPSVVFLVFLVARKPEQALSDRPT